MHKKNLMKFQPANETEVKSMSSENQKEKLKP